MQNDAANSIRIFFRCMGYSFVILSFRVALVYGFSAQAVETLLNTFAYIFSIAPAMGIIGMFTVDSYNWFKKKIYDALTRYFR